MHIWSLILDDRIGNTINSMNIMKCSFALKKGQELWQREGEYEQCQEYDEVLVWLYHFAKRYLEKLVDE